MNELYLVFVLGELNSNLLRWGNIVAFIVMLIVNGLANTTLIGGRTTADISNQNPTLITPAGYVFAIWGIIYALLAVFLVYQALPRNKDKPFQKQISALFILSCIFNIVWLFFWQNNLLAISTVIIFGFLATLIAIYLRLNIGKSNMPVKEKVCVQVPFSVYVGWVTIASIANVAVTLVSAGWDGFGLSLETWALIVLGLALIIDLAVIATRRDIAYSLVFVWALAGIAVNQSSHPNIVLIGEVAIVVIIVALAAATAISRLRRHRSGQK
jgi:translocator protein